MKFALALLIAVHFWGARDVHVPCHPVAAAVDGSQLPEDMWGFPAPMASDPTGCLILIGPEDQTMQTQAPGWYCMDVVHEVGHLAGLAHTRTGVMAEYTGWGDVPYDCRHPRRFLRSLRHPSTEAPVISISE